MTEGKPQPPPGFQAEKVRCPLRHARRQTALCTVGHSGNDLHYRGYDITDLAAHCEFEEVAYLLVHGKLPTRSRTGRLQGQSASLAQPPRAREAGARAAAAIRAPHGRAAHRRLRAGLRAARGPRPQRSRRARHRRCAAGLAAFHASLLAPLRAQRPPHRGGDERTTRSLRIFCICCTASLRAPSGRLPCRRR